MSKKAHISTTINGEPVEFLCETRQSLLEVLRDVLQLTGSKEGCNNGNCGACTVLLDGVPVNSCLVLGVEAEGAEITTIEGIADDEPLAPDSTVLFGKRRAAVRHLHARLHRGGQGAAGPQPQSDRTRHPLLNWRATSAAARATTKSSAPCKPPPRTCRRPTANGYRYAKERVRSVRTTRRQRQRPGQALQGDRHAPHPPRRRRQGDRPRDLRQRRSFDRLAARQDSPQPARPCADQVDRHLGSRKAAGRAGGGHGARICPT